MLEWLTNIWRWCFGVVLGCIRLDGCTLVLWYNRHRLYDNDDKMKHMKIGNGSDVFLNSRSQRSLVVDPSFVGGGGEFCSPRKAKIKLCQLLRIFKGVSCFVDSVYNCQLLDMTNQVFHLL